MTYVRIIKNHLEPETVVSEDGDVLEICKKHFGEWNEFIRIYSGPVCKVNDITPESEADCERLRAFQGELTIIQFVGDPTGGLLFIIGAVIAVTIGVVSFIQSLVKKVPNSALRNQQTSSPNNELAARSNSARPGARIPDIVGQVRSTPDLIASTYSIYENNVEIQVDYMCIGRGTYDVSDPRDDKTKISQIFGASIEVYGPGTSPNSGSPQLTVGDAITYPLVAAARSNSVNGQTLLPSDSISVSYTMRFVSPDTIEMLDSSSIKFTDRFTAADEVNLITPSILDSASSSDITGTATLKYGAGRVIFTSVDPSTVFTVGDVVTVSTATYHFTPPGSMGTGSISANGTFKASAVDSTTVTFTNIDGTTQTSWGWIDPLFGGETPAQSVTLINYGSASYINLDGTYNITTVNDYSLVLTDPVDTNAAWGDLAGLSGSASYYQDSTVSKVSDTDVGPFVLDVTTLTQVYMNFVALNGLYQDDGTNQTALSVDLRIDITPVNSSGTPIGSTESTTVTITGSASTRDTIAQTIMITPTFTGRCSVKVTRVTALVANSKSQIVQEIKWRDLYAISPIIASDFGDVTTVYSKTRATAGALSLKDRKLNMLVTRMIPTRISGSTFTTVLSATRRADEILAFLCLDQKFGNRQPSEIDFDSIYDTVAAIETYFGNAIACEFNYTYDNDTMSFEECAQALASVLHSNLYRRGRIIYMSFEKATDDSVMLFNHRNKLPGTEKRLVQFGGFVDNDGVELKYVSKVDDAVVTFYVPEDMTAINPKKLETIGVRNKLQARFLAYRAYNKIRYQNTTSSFQATEEAALLVLGDRILNADNSRPDTQDGEVIGQVDLVLTLSQKVTFVGGRTYTIFLMHTDKTVESIGITAGSSSNQVVLAGPPSVALVTGANTTMRTVYMIAGSTDANNKGFIITDRGNITERTFPVTAVNYDARYYANDKDLINGVVNSDGNLL